MCLLLKGFKFDKNLSMNIILSFPIEDFSRFLSPKLLHFAKGANNKIYVLSAKNQIYL